MRCKVCATKTHVDSIGKKKEKYYFCPACDYIFKDHSLYPAPAEEIKRYRQHKNTLEDTGYIKMLEEFINTALCPFAEQASRVLDFGSGPEPVFSRLLADRGFQVDIYDIYFAPDLDFSNKQYDLVTLIEVAEHLKNPALIFRQLVDLLPRGGLLCLMTRFHPGDITAFRQWWYRQDFTHVGFFSRITLQYLAAKLNLTLVYTDNTCACTFRKI